MAAEVKNGLFSPLPKKDEIATSSGFPKQSNSNRLRGPSKFRNSAKKNSKQLQSRNNRKSSKISRSTPKRNINDNSFQSRRNLRTSLFSGSNQEIPTQVSSAQTTGHQSTNNIKRNTISTTEEPSYNDTTGFAPKAPPPHAKQFNPFASQQTTTSEQHSSNFRFKASSNSRNKVFDNNNGKQNNRNNHLAKAKNLDSSSNDARATSDNVIIKGFAPKAPPPFAKQFNPVPGASENNFQFDEVFKSTTGFPDFFTTDYDDEDSFNHFTDYDSNTPGSRGKALSDTTSFSHTTTQSVPDSGAQNQQISVLSALSSSGNVLNSPKYTVAGKADKTHATNQEFFFSTTESATAFITNARSTNNFNTATETNEVQQPNVARGILSPKTNSNQLINNGRLQSTNTGKQVQQATLPENNFRVVLGDSQEPPEYRDTIEIENTFNYDDTFDNSLYDTLQDELLSREINSIARGRQLGTQQV